MPLVALLQPSLHEPCEGLLKEVMTVLTPVARLKRVIRAPESVKMYSEVAERLYSEVAECQLVEQSWME